MSSWIEHLEIVQTSNLSEVKAEVKIKWNGETNNNIQSFVQVFVERDEKVAWRRWKILLKANSVKIFNKKSYPSSFSSFRF